ncbi:MULTISPECIES: TIGR03668 family PPOX class F420-dependent oxidoreductase [Streptomyces]|uniref:TIGR03668 family PPOX class F420-dependent oxidoreductase n=1 Tax=Streptomyces dengpaensis TaxID=2049881 RepID=A0ABM6SKG7_9ACTN|nr:MULTISPECIES: TIGR03668 family PPOX class F420-dependent oxidoreductase [Streptomyces]AVH54967.1 TIGR03668 family PPOX class F420-dependent oxidoreductase [Streptomyces dengpaensis]PIB08267.1 PPOX class F420-dependent oxidoreductase [Streptomyces sp. HG99]
MPDLDEDEARRRFLTARSARLATVDAELRPHLVPVVFAAHGGEIVTAIDHKPKRTQRVKRLRNIAAHPAVCLLVDAYDEDWDRLWWVRADGDARIVPPGAPEPPVEAAYAAAIAALRDKYAQYQQQPPDGPVIAITVHRWHGWRAAPTG